MIRIYELATVLLFCTLTVPIALCETHGIKVSKDPMPSDPKKPFKYSHDHPGESKGNAIVIGGSKIEWTCGDDCDDIDIAFTTTPCKTQIKTRKKVTCQVMRVVDLPATAPKPVASSAQCGAKRCFAYSVILHAGSANLTEDPEVIVDDSSIRKGYGLKSQPPAKPAAQ